jgi:cell division protein FtsW
VDIEKASYHVQHSLQAFFQGGILGRGLGASREKFGLLPAPHTDSIYAVLGEELGLIGALLVLLLFFVLLWRGFRAAVNAPDRLASLLASGITFWIGVEAFINMSVLRGCCLSPAMRSPSSALAAPVCWPAWPARGCC